MLNVKSKSAKKFRSSLSTRYCQKTMYVKLLLKKVIYQKKECSHVRVGNFFGSHACFYLIEVDLYMYLFLLKTTQILYSMVLLIHC